MNKQEQINEIAKYMCNVCDFKCDSFLSGEFCAAVMENAEAIYNKVEEELNQLKTECTLLDDELRNARQETINVLNKVKDYVNQLACDEYGDSACDTNYVTIDIDKYEQDIDELIKEVLNAENKG